MTWKYYIHDSNDQLVTERGGFQTEGLALAAGGEHAKKLSSTRSSASQVYTVTVGRDYVFRVVAIKDGSEIRRSVDLIGACVQWVKNPKEFRVERVLVGATTPDETISTGECCKALKQWLSTNPHFISKDEREDMKQLITEACGGQ